MNYKIILGNQTDLETQHAKLSKQGWKPQGGVSITRDSYSGLWFAQAFVREEKNSENGPYDQEKTTRTKK